MADSQKLSDEELMKRIAANKPQSDSYESVSDDDLMARIASLKSQNTDAERPLAAAVESAGDALTFGYAPQIKAGITEGINKISGVDRAKILATFDRPIDEVISGQAYENLPKLNSYVDTRDYASKAAAQLKEENPKAAIAGMVGGALLPIGAAATSLRGLKGAALARGIGKAGLTGGAMSAAYNPGDVKGEITPFQPAERLQNAAVGGGLSMLLGAGGAALSAAAPQVKGAANSLAARALGRGTKKLKTRIGDKGLEEMGDAALKNGVIGWIPRGIKKINERSRAFLDKAGKQIGAVMDDIDEVEKVARSDGFKVGISKSKIADKVKSEVIGEFDDPQYIKEVERRLGRFMERGADDLIPTKALHGVKSEIGNSMRAKGVWDRVKMKTTNQEDRFYLALYDTLDDAILDASNGAAKISNKPGLAGKIQNANKLYTQGKRMVEISGDELNRSNTNNILGLISAIGGAGEYARSGDPVKALALAGGIQALKRGGPQVGAKLLDTASKVMRRSSTIPVNAKTVGLLTGENLKQKRESGAMERRLKGNK